MPKDPLKEGLQNLQVLRKEGCSDQGLKFLQMVFKKQTGILVAKAADVATEWNATVLAPDLHDAFYRLTEHALERDPQCWGKTAIIKALYDLAWQDQQIYIEACRTVQLEPVYGGYDDSAVSLRMAAIRILVQLPAADTLSVMMEIADLLADKSAKVRAEAARACVYLQPLLAVPLLRLKIGTGDADARVLGMCFDALLLLLPDERSLQLILAYAAPKAAKDLKHVDEQLQVEAMASLASSAVPQAIRAVRGLYAELKDSQLQRVLITALGVSTAEEAHTFLSYLAQEGNDDERKWAREALKTREVI